MPSYNTFGAEETNPKSVGPSPYDPMPDSPKESTSLLGGVPDPDRSLSTQLKLVLWKNWLLKKRTAKSTFSEVFVPVVFILILVMIRALVDVKHIDEQLLTQYRMPVTASSTILTIDASCGHYSVFQYGGRHAFAPLAQVAIVPASEDDAALIGPLVDHYKTKFVQGLREAENMPIVGPFLANGTWNCYNPPIDIDGEDYIQNEMFRTDFKNEKELIKYVESSSYSKGTHRPIMLAVVIGKEAGENQWSVRFRTNHTRAPDTHMKEYKFVTYFEFDMWREYMDNGVMSLKLFTDQFIMQSEGVDHQYLPTDVIAVPFPERKSKKDNMYNYVANVFGLLLVCAFMWPFSRLVRNMVEEKEKRIREGMKMMGLSDTAIWMSWAITYFIIFLAFILIATVIGNITFFRYSDTSLIFLFFTLFVLTLIALAMLVTTFFNRAKTAGTLSNFALFGAYLPYIAVSSTGRSASSKAAACLMSPVALSLGGTQILQYESSFIGATWSNVNEVNDNFSMATALWMMFFDIFIYAFLAWYFDKVLPKEFGTHKPWHFVFHASYWCGGDSEKKQSDSTRSLTRGSMHEMKAPFLASTTIDIDGNASDSSTSAFKQTDHIEEVPETLRDKVGVRIDRLVKKFSGTGPDGGDHYAVKGLSLELYRGQIFVLLGHNGAGKSTTINMLTGMLPISSGTATVAGNDVATEMDQVRKNMGICPQHDILFDTLTVREHLEYYGSLKGVTADRLADEVENSIEEVQLEPQSNQVSGSLSGGQKRRLSLAIALIGNSPIVFLDEPTSGVDPFSRRAIWNLLSKKKAGRTIVLTTHFMDEADQLGDRIAILHQGMLKCAGSSLYLKKLYGVGYTLTITRSQTAEEGAEETLPEDELKMDGGDIRGLVKERIPKAKLLSDVGTEISFQLPLDASPAFPELLKILDKDGDELGVQNYGLSVTTLEEVFLKVAHEEDETPDEQEKTKELVRRLSSRSRADSTAGYASASNVLGASLKHRGVFRDFGALLKKRWDIQKRDKKATCCQFVAPIVLLLLGFFLLRIPPNFDFPTLAFSPDSQYPQPVLTPYNDVPQVASDEYLALLGQDVQLQKAGAGVDNVTSMAEYLLRTIKDEKEDRFGAYLFDSMQPKVGMANYHIFTNMTGAHSLPTFLAASDDALYKQVTKNNDSAIVSSINPLPFTALEKSLIQSVNGLFGSIVIALAFAFVPSAVAVFVTKDREQYCKHLQRISGVNMNAYWFSAYVWDYATFLVPALLGAAIVYGFGNPNFVGENFPVVVVNFLLYGASVIPFTYVWSFLFSSHSTAQNVMIVVYIFGGIIMLSVSVALYFIPSTREANSSYIRHLFRIIPNFCMADTMFWLSVRGQPFIDLSQWDMDVSGYNFIFMTVEAIGYFIITLVIEYISSNPALAAKLKPDPDPIPVDDPNEDVDVIAERNRIRNNYGKPKFKDIITIQGLRKVFPTRDKGKNKVAVDNLWFSLPPGECFGFLGVNGAGKTTTLNMMTGRLTCSHGTAKLGGYDILQHPEETRRLMGYCPQFDALYEHLTGEEHLFFYGRIRGVPESQLHKMVGYLIARLTLTPHAKKPAGTYSGGNKRKLSVGIALIGNPRVVFLDEPSTGMDPVSRRFMWDFINDSMADRAVILTTHSMEECEALCNRIGILSLGKLKCVGTSQHLKHRFGNNLQLEITTGQKDIEAARSFIRTEFPDSHELEAYGGSLKYKVPLRQGLSLAYVFSLIEDNKDRVGISQYALGQTSLEQIFIQFAKEGDDTLRAEKAKKDASESK